MSVSNGQSANQTTFNNAFMSRTTDTSTTGKIDLEDSGSDSITDLQQVVNNHDDSINALEAQNLVENTGGSSTDNAVPRFNGTGGTDIQDSGVLIDDSNNVTIPGDLTVNGTTTTINTATLDVADQNITVNDGGNDASSEGAGLTVERTGTDGSIVYEDALTSKFKLGALGSEVEVADVSSSQQLTGKDYDGGTASNTSRMTMPKNTKSNLDGLTRKEGTFVYATDEAKPYYDNGSILVDFGAGGSGVGGVNYLEGDDFDFEDSVGNWVAYADAAATSPVDGTGGSPTATVTRTTTASEILRGTGSLEIAKDAADRQGEGGSVDFTIDNADKGKLLEISFDYSTSANYASGDIRLFVYDRDGASVLAVLNDDDGDLLSGSGKFVGKFQADSTNDDYRLIFHIATTNASAYDVFIDNVKVGPEGSLNVPLVTPWVDYTPTGRWTTNATYTGKWRRVGDTMECQAYITLSGAPAGAGGLFVSIPDGFTIDSTKLAGASGTIQNLGSAYCQDNGVDAFPGIAAYFDSTTVLLLSLEEQNETTNDVRVNSINQTQPFTFASGDIVHAKWSVPIDGWSTGALVSTTETLFKSANSYANEKTPTGTIGAAFNTVVFGTVNEDALSLYNTSTGQWTAPIDGTLIVSAHLEFAQTASTATAAVAITNTTTGEEVIGVDKVRTADTVAYPVASGQLSVSAGDVIEIQSWNNGTSPSFGSSFGKSGFSIAYKRDLSIFGVYGETDLIESSSDLISYAITADQQGDLTSIDLPPGKWDISAHALYFSNGATTTTNVQIGISTTSGNSTTGLTFGDNWMVGQKDTTSGTYTPITIARYNVSPTSSTTYYLKARASTSATNLEVAYKISARKV